VGFPHQQPGLLPHLRGNNHSYLLSQAICGTENAYLFYGYGKDFEESAVVAGGGN
jgi:hypothetical protein